MSHKATNWAFEVKNLRPGAKLVLLALADCHNPRHGCFPSQEYLACVCCMSERSVRDQLDALEAAGHIRRVQVNSGKGRQSNRYILGFENDETHPTANSADGVAQRQITSSPTANHDSSQRQNLPPNPVKEPVSNLCVEDTHKIFKEFWGVHPRPIRKDETLAAFTEAIRLGIDPKWIVHAARLYAKEQEGNGKQYIATSLGWLENSRWTDFDPPNTSSTPDDKRAFYEARLSHPIQSIRESAQRALMEMEGAK